jgi:peptidoglycan/xylan/chitin deacetylase (PgdA/CDA1 family)
VALSNAIKRILLLPGLTSAYAPLLADTAVIFMLHRFSMPAYGIKGDSPAHLRAALEELRKGGFRFVSLLDLWSKLERGDNVSRMVAFTLDDGYWDEGIVAGPIFREFDCPATIFLSTGFLDGILWQWWDRVEFIFENTRLQSVAVRVDDFDRHYRWSDRQSRQSEVLRCHEDCKLLPEKKKLRFIDGLAENAEVQVPASPPLRYAPLTWEQVRQCEKLGLTFGPHTVTHPILANASPEQSDCEIKESWRRLKEEVKSPVPIFCYPNGRAQDFGDREFCSIEAAGLRGAVTGIAGYAGGTDFRSSRNGRHLVRRFGLPCTMVDLKQYVYGLERLKQIVRN